MAESTDEQVFEAYEKGIIDEATYNSFLDGDDIELPEGDTDKKLLDGDSPDSKVEDELAAAKELEAAEALKQEELDKADSQKKPLEGDDEVIVLAKDGKHTLPFSVVEDLRTTVSELKAENQQVKEALEKNNGLLEEKLADAKKTDEEEGNTDATDNLLLTLDEDYPGIVKALSIALGIDAAIAPIKENIETLVADKKGRDVLTAEQKERVSFDSEVDKLEPTYSKVKDTQEFWDWMDSKPSYIREVENSADPEQVAEVVKLYNKETADAGVEKPEVKLDDQLSAVEKAKAIAAKKAGVQSLSDLPGGPSLNNEEEQIDQMTNDQYLAMLSTKTPDEIEKIMSRHV